MALAETYDVVVVGGGPAGATAAADLARRGHSVVLLDRAGRIKPCGGAIPPRLIRDFDIPDHLLVARIHSDGRILRSSHEAEGTAVHARVPQSLASALGEYASG